MSIELSMIVKNAASTLARCLESVRASIDEIVIVDTGSTDATIDIARQYGARVIQIPWNDDFAAARNAALRHGKCDWVLSLDADEVLDEASTSSILDLVSAPDAMGYEVCIWNYVRTLNTRMLNSAAQPNPRRIGSADAFPGYVEHFNVRLFRRHPEIFFEGCIHESVADRMRRLGLKVTRSELLIHHLGIAEAEEEERKRKTLYYQELGKRKLADSPDDVRAWFELGLGELESLRNPSAALPYFERAIALKPESNILWTYAAICMVRLGKSQEALKVLAHAERLGARSAVYFEALGDAKYYLQQFTEAQQSYMAAKTAGSYSSALEGKLGVCEVRTGSAVSGLKRIQQAIGQEPGFGELYDMLMLAALIAGNADLAKETASRRLNLGDCTPDSFIMISAMWRYLQDLQRATDVLREGCRQFPDNEALRSSLQQLQ